MARNRTPPWKLPTGFNINALREELVGQSASEAEPPDDAPEISPVARTMGTVAILPAEGTPVDIRPIPPNDTAWRRYNLRLPYNTRWRHEVGQAVAPEGLAVLRDAIGAHLAEQALGTTIWHNDPLLLLAGASTGRKAVEQAAQFAQVERFDLSRGDSDLSALRPAAQERLSSWLRALVGYQALPPRSYRTTTGRSLVSFQPCRAARRLADSPQPLAIEVRLQPRRFQATVEALAQLGNVPARSAIHYSPTLLLGTLTPEIATINRIKAAAAELNEALTASPIQLALGVLGVRFSPAKINS